MNQKCDKQTKDLLMYYKKQSFFVDNLNSLFCRKVSKILKSNLKYFCQRNLNFIKKPAMITTLQIHKQFQTSQKD